MEEYKRTPFANITFRGSFLSHCAESSGSAGGTGNIDNIKKYRDAKFSNMTNEKMSSEYQKTAWLDGLDSNSTKNASKAKEYINAKLSAMSNEDGYKFLKGE